MDEYREALQKLSDAVEDTMREHYKELGCCSVTRARLDEAKALLARPEPDIEDEVNEGVWQLKLEGDRQDAAVFEAFGSCEPAAAEKAREPMHEGFPVDTIVRDIFTDKVGTIVSYHCRFEVEWADGSKSMDVHCRQLDHCGPLPSPPAATGETK